MQAKKPLDKNSLKERDQRIKARLDELREFAADEDESLNEESIADFLSLMSENESFLAPYIFSNYEGNISITWKNEREKLSVVFEGNNQIELTQFIGITKDFVPLPNVWDTSLENIIPIIRRFFGFKPSLYVVREAVEKKAKEMAYISEQEYIELSKKLIDTHKSLMETEVLNYKNKLDNKLNLLQIEADYLLKYSKFQSEYQDLISKMEREVFSYYNDIEFKMVEKYIESINNIEKEFQKGKVSKFLYKKTQEILSKKLNDDMDMSSDMLAFFIKKMIEQANFVNESQFFSNFILESQIHANL